MKRDIHLEETYPFPPERVWTALTDSAAIADWLMPNNFAPKLGHRFQFHTKPQPGFDGIVNCEVIELEPPRRLAFTWAGGGIQTVARFVLEPVAGGTLLKFEHTGFRGPRAMMVSFILGSGWKSKILPKNLPECVARVSEEGYRPLAADGLERKCG
jgi:uncharacterized protein YndB with AHSA1/START domain